MLTPPWAMFRVLRNFPIEYQIWTEKVVNGIHAWHLRWNWIGQVGGLGVGGATRKIRFRVIYEDVNSKVLVCTTFHKA